MKKYLILCAAILLTACAKNSDIFSDDNRQKSLKEAYSDNFRNTYPNVNLNQSWDYSLKVPTLSLPASGNASAPGRRASAVNYSWTEGEPYEVEQSTLDWMKQYLVESKDNRALGKPFYMKVPSNSFSIVPIFQGHAAAAWELHVVVDGVDMKVWEKSQNIWVKKTANADWITLKQLNSNQEYQQTDAVAAVKATPYTFNNLPAGHDMYFYLKATKSGSINGKVVCATGDEMSSLEGLMLSIEDECPVPSNLVDEGYKVTIISCEDAKREGTDWDINDVVFMVYGKPEVPTTVEIEEGDPIEQKTTVRYMIEDLGATDDFDFNDIVVDVTDIITVSPIYVNGIFSEWSEPKTHRQEAVIRHLGGTLPFTLTIGNTQLPEIQGQLDVDPTENNVFAVSGWDYNSHNISVRVREKNNTGVYNDVRFPKAGEAPMIIAVEPTVGWMKERVQVPESWFFLPEE